MINRLKDQEMERTLRVLIMREREYLVAQCLEYDLAVQAMSLEELRERFANLVKEHILLALHHGDVPFACLETAPTSNEHLWQNASKIGMLATNLTFKFSIVTDHPLPQEAEMAIAS